MPLDILITTDRINSDPVGRQFIDHLRASQDRLGLSNAALYYDFPTYSDYETVSHKPDALLVSPRHGVLAFRFQGAGEGEATTQAADTSLVQFCSTLIGRLLKSRLLRKGLSQLTFSVTPVLFGPQGILDGHELESTCVASLSGVDDLLSELDQPEISPNALAETRSVVEGAKALARARSRIIDDPQTQRLAAAIARLESEIANFDERQRRVALVSVTGPQRIRGLAGSGKTVILAMKAAHLHLTRPDEQILVTFWTRSLRAALTGLITRFYRHYRDEDPDWDRIHVRHGWGGSSTSGAYADACRRAGAQPLSYPDAQKSAAAAVAGTGNRVDPFDYICRSLVAQREIVPFYDHVLIDEGQDFPTGFYELCFFITKGERDVKNIVWAYDELQNILDVRLRTPEQLFGTDRDGQPRISLDRTSSQLPPGASNDHVLSKCYRNQREVLVSAHALGFGVYGQIVQMLESREHWEDVGYNVLSPGPLSVGEKVVVERPVTNSPVSLLGADIPPLIQCEVADSFNNEVLWVRDQVVGFLEGGMQPEDVLIICLDDRNSRAYFRHISSALAASEIATNNILADPYNEPSFTISGHVTLSTVYRAKGNEASVVLAAGVQAVATKTRLGRNKLFTAFTRTKAWLRVSGCTSSANDVCKELSASGANFPNIQFQMPDLKKIDTIQRDLSNRSIRARRIRQDFIKKLVSEGFGEEEAADILALEAPNGKA